MSTVIKLRDVAFNNLALPTLEGASLIAGGDTRERDAVGHYLFGNSAQESYSDLSGKGNTLSPSVNDPTFGTNYVTVDFNSPLNTGLGVGTEITLACVMQIQAGIGGSAVGVFGASSATPSGRADRNGVDLDGGALIYQSAGAQANASYYPDSSTGAAGTGRSFPDGTWVFLAYSISSAQALWYVPAFSPTAEIKTGGSPEITTGQTIHVGNHDYVGSLLDDPVKVAEAVVFNYALTQEELEALYVRSSYRMQQRGIII